MSNTYLIIASRRGITAEKVRQLLLDERVDLDYSDATGRTALHYACAVNNYEAAEVLIEKGADVVSEDRWGETPLHAASSRGHLEILQVLLKAGSNANAVDRFGKTPLWLVCESSRIDDTLRLQMMHLLIEYGAKVDFAGADGTTLLHAACKRNNAEVVRCLLDHGSYVNVVDKAGETPLHVACRRGDVRVVRLLLQHKANPNAQCTSDGWSPLHVACGRRGNFECVQCLVAFGGDSMLPNKIGLTPIILAANNFDVAAVKAIILTAFIHQFGPQKGAAGQC